jgi:hypothetical protein
MLPVKLRVALARIGLRGLHALCGE